MPAIKCTKCGGTCELLLNLVCCSGARCQNFDKSFFNRWLKGCGRTHKAPSSDWKFLGRFQNHTKFPKLSDRIYDLYAHGPDTYAVFGDQDDNIYAGNTEGEPVGYYLIFWSGPEDIDASGADALLEAAARGKAI